MVSSQDSCPECYASNLYSGDKRSGVFRIPRRNASPAFEVQEGVFHQLAQFVEVFVITALVFAVFLGRNHGCHLLLNGLLDDGICIVALVGQQVLRC